MLQADSEQLATAMDWVIPADGTPGAGSVVGVEHLLDLVASLGAETENLYSQYLPTLEQSDLRDAGHPFAPMFIEHVRDVYYAYADTGAWSDIGFEVTG